MKIAFVSDDRENISGHFGRAIGFMVYELEGNTIQTNEYRLNDGGNKGQCGTCQHDKIINTIKDCQTVVARGMGRRIHEDLKNSGIRTVLTDETIIKTALDKIIRGAIVNHPEKIH
jgi:predicted Fe-Mo cluster-binding NifX family protein